MKKKAAVLSQQHRRFVHAYRRTRHAARAYQEVYERASWLTACSEGSRLLNNPKISQEINSLDTADWAKEAMTQEEIKARMARLARVNIADYYWAPGEVDRNGQPTEEGVRKPLSELTPAQQECIKGYKFSLDGIVVPEFWDKPKQLENIGKHLGVLREKVDHEGLDGATINLRWVGDNAEPE